MNRPCVLHRVPVCPSRPVLHRLQQLKAPHARSKCPHRARHWRVCAENATAAPVKERPRPGEKKGFIEEMRIVAMKLHTKDQAPKEGGKEAAKQPFQKWEPTREGYLRFLVESLQVYEAIEATIEAAPKPEYARFQHSGLERAGRLQKDIQHLAQEYSLEVPQPQEQGPGKAYAGLLRQLAAEVPPLFICHFYNTYFAHTAGGRMIGAKVASMILEGKTLEFYKYDGDMKELLQGVRDNINEVAESWTREEKDKCLSETEKAFQYAGGLLRCITE